MNKIRLTSLILGFAILTGCAGVGPLPTPSGNPEVTINSGNKSRIKELMITRFAANGFAIKQDTQYMLMVSKPMDTGDAMMYQLALGNAYSSAPEMNISLTLAPVGKTTRVYGRIAVGMQGVFGQSQGTDLTRGKAGHQLQAILEQVKADAER